MPRNEYPTNYSAAVRVLRSPHRSRTVWLSSRVHRTARYAHLPEVFDVTGPTAPGTVLRIEVWSGIPRLNILSGNVTIAAASTWGNSVTVQPAAASTTTVHVQTGCKAHVYGLPAEHVSGDLSRAYVQPSLPAAPTPTPTQPCPF